ncbi:MAG: DnaJ domain-containing protein [Myxococcota bacterium]
MRTSFVACSTLEGVDVECTHCGLRMTSHVGSGGQIRYFHCPGCQRWSTSVYPEVFKADTKLRTRKPRGEEPRAAFGSVKERLSRWLESLGGADEPWRVLGCSPTDTEERIRERYLALARRYHPDAGGSLEKMQQLNRAYEQVLGEREAERQRGLPASAHTVP